MNSSPSVRLSPLDWLRREWYVTKTDFFAQDVPGGYRKGQRRELRSDLSAAASQVGMSQAVRDLGPASALAHQLKLAEGRKLPHWWTGVITFSIILYAMAGMALATAHGLSEAAAQVSGDRTVTVHAVWLWLNIEVTRGEHVLSAAIESSSITLALLVVVPLIASRAWRYRPAWLQRRLETRRRQTSSLT